MRLLAVSLLVIAMGAAVIAQQSSSAPVSEASKPDTSKQKKSKTEAVPSEPTSQPATQAQPAQQTTPTPETKPESGKPPGDKEAEVHYDMTEVAPVVTHHQVTVDGKALRYTATVGRLPIKRDVTLRDGTANHFGRCNR